ncbi:ATP-binding cassette domain-containing protein [Streptomyces sp. NPDC005969]|uniref:ATP-binding cassette domain-containing protein n=1 Tax=Streptomyces sp. NPDC005969 TaxID=3156722 RepID=UPI0033D51BE2
MLELVDITKVYRGGKRAVDGMTMRLETGMLGLLGPNGAGKSSLMRIASTVTRPTSGQVVFALRYRRRHTTIHRPARRVDIEGKRKGIETPDRLSCVDRRRHAVLRDAHGRRGRLVETIQLGTQQHQ